MKKIFSAEKYKAWAGYSSDEALPLWVKGADGQVVVDGSVRIRDPYDKYVEDVMVSDNWCELLPEVGVGDYVKLKNKRGGLWNTHGAMDQYIGAVVRVSELKNMNTCFEVEYGYASDNSNYKYWFSIDDIEREATTAEIEKYKAEHPIEPADGPVKTEDVVNHPKHYCREGGMESIDEMVEVFGREAVMNFCICNVWKYRYRASSKNGEEDLKKSDWYMRKYKELKEEESK